MTYNGTNVSPRSLQYLLHWCFSKNLFMAISDKFPVQNWYVPSPVSKSNDAISGSYSVYPAPWMSRTIKLPLRFLISKVDKGLCLVTNCTLFTYFTIIVYVLNKITINVLFNWNELPTVCLTHEYLFIFKCWAKLHQLLFFNLFLHLGCKIAGQVMHLHWLLCVTFFSFLCCFNYFQGTPEVLLDDPCHFFESLCYATGLESLLESTRSEWCLSCQEFCLHWYIGPLHVFKIKLIDANDSGTFLGDDFPKF